MISNKKFYNKWDSCRQRHCPIYFPDLITGQEWYNTTPEHWLNPYLQIIQRQYKLFFDLRVRRWVVYKFIDSTVTSYSAKQIREYCGKYTLIMVIDGPGRCYREPGFWLYNLLKSKSLLRDTKKEGIRLYLDKLDEPSEAEKNYISNMKAIREEMNKDKDMIGRVSDFLSRKGPVKPKGKAKKMIFVGIKSGKVLKVVNPRKNNC